MSPRPHEGSYPPGEGHPSAKLTDELVRAIRRAPGSHAKIGRRFGVAPNTVGKIKRRESWKHLPTKPPEPPPDTTNHPAPPDDTVPTLEP